MHPFSSDYSAVPQHEEVLDDKDVENVSTAGEDIPPPRFFRLTNAVRNFRLSTTREHLRNRRTRKLALGVLSVCGLLASYVLMYILGSRSRDLDQLCLEKTSTFSPALDARGAKTHMVKFNGTLGYPSEFTGPNHGDPSPDIDAAWDKWAYVKYFSIDEDDFMKIPGADPDAARLTPEYGGGYIGFLEVSHHMHCLNMLRQAIYKDYYTTDPHAAPLFSDTPFTVKVHIQHCLEIMRQNIMCNADVGVITHQWISYSPDPFANFNTYHKCHNIDAVEKWIHEHEIPDTPDGSDLPIPLGSKIYARPP